MSLMVSAVPYDISVALFGKTTVSTKNASNSSLNWKKLLLFFLKPSYKKGANWLYTCPTGQNNKYALLDFASMKKKKKTVWEAYSTLGLSLREYGGMSGDCSVSCKHNSYLKGCFWDKAQGGRYHEPLKLELLMGREKEKIIREQPCKEEKFNHRLLE